jgi:hypothetical protein
MYVFVKLMGLVHAVHNSAYKAHTDLLSPLRVPAFSNFVCALIRRRSNSSEMYVLFVEHNRNIRCVS